MNLPPLYSPNKRGALKVWSIRVLPPSDVDTAQAVIVEIRHGLHGGKMIVEERRITDLKRGSTTLLEQAQKWAQSRWNHKHDREHYSTSITTTTTLIAPMLAKTFEEGRHVDLPALVQPKLDGLRCLACLDPVSGDTVLLLSRTGREFRSPLLDAIRVAAAPLLRAHRAECLALDGELFSWDLAFEELSGLCRQDKNVSGISSAEKRIAYHVFDMIPVDASMSCRERLLHRLSIMALTEPLVRVETRILHDLDEIPLLHREFVEQGYEGIMIRNEAGIYRRGFRSWDLQKHKTFLEEEFTIVGFHEGSGRDQNTVIWECETKTQPPQRFRARPRGSLEHRRHLLLETASHIGRPLTVLFQEYTADGLPRFPVGKAIRFD